MGSTYSADSENQKTGKGTSVEERLAHVFAKGKFNVNLRYRYEFVNQDGLNRNAHANTLRARIGYTTGTFYGFSAKAEGEAIALIGHEFLTVRQMEAPRFRPSPIQKNWKSINSGCDIQTYPRL